MWLQKIIWRPVQWFFFDCVVLFDCWRRNLHHECFLLWPSFSVQNCLVAVPSSQYIRKHVLPRLFAAMDAKRDNVIDFEEYVCAVALFRIGSTEEKIKSELQMFQEIKCISFSKSSYSQIENNVTYSAEKKNDLLPFLFSFLCCIPFLHLLFFLVQFYFSCTSLWRGPTCQGNWMNSLLHRLHWIIYLYWNTEILNTNWFHVLR